MSGPLRSGLNAGGQDFGSPQIPGACQTSHGDSNQRKGRSQCLMERDVEVFLLRRPPTFADQDITSLDPSYRRQTVICIGRQPTVATVDSPAASIIVFINTLGIQLPKARSLGQFAADDHRHTRIRIFLKIIICTRA